MSTRLGEAILGEMVIGSENANGWKNPKTNWTSNDYFNVEDYNRMINNIIFLQKRINELFYNFPEIKVGENKMVGDLIFAKEINDIEEAVELLNSMSYQGEIGNKMLFYTNKPTPMWWEFNRLENAMLFLYTSMNAHKKTLPHLSFRLGGEKHF